jgi:hypothetical protein
VPKLQRPVPVKRQGVYAIFSSYTIVLSTPAYLPPKRRFWWVKKSGNSRSGVQYISIDLKLRRISQMLFYSTLVRGANNRLFILFRKAFRKIDVQNNFVDHVREWIHVHALCDFQTFSRDPSLFAKAENVNSRAGSDGSQEQRKGRGCSTILVGLYDERSIVGIHCQTSGKRDFKIQFLLLSNAKKRFTYKMMITGKGFTTAELLLAGVERNDYYLWNLHAVLNAFPFVPVCGSMRNL